MILFRTSWLVGLITPLFALVFNTDCFGHDLWLIPPELAKVNIPFTIRAHSGMEFPISVHAPNPNQFTRRFVILPDGKETALVARGKEELSGLLDYTPNRPGIYIAAVTTEPKLITLSAEEFNHYHVADGLPHIYLMRHKESALGQPGRERYSKSPKTLLQVGDGKEGNPCRTVGLPLEIVPLRNPFQLKVCETLPVKVLFDQRPLADAHLGWDVPGDGEEPSGTVRTNAKGEALIPISQTGLMTIRLTHMTRAKAADYDWESFWTTLTFRIPK
ncbi:MAG TPA: DUF4198 domain-containing protein [Gemmatales bacterium]|nr:DUF4198 domain-containing protein [Gemmatales bacterium]